MSNDGVFVGIASYGGRASMLQIAVMSLLDQVDRIGVYLNNYEEVPEFLINPRIEVALSQDHGDLRDNGKFFFLGGSSYRFYAAADDDIAYAPDYISRLKAVVAKAGPIAAVAVHGAVYPTRILGLLNSRRLYHFGDPLQHVMPVHLVGTGTLLFEQRHWALRFDEFGEPGMADVWFALAARKRSGRLFIVNRDRGWLRDISGEGQHRRSSRGPSLFAEAKANDSVQTQLLSDAAISEGGIDELLEWFVESDSFAEELTLSQAVAFDQLRRELGWRPVSSRVAESIRTRLRSTRTGWSEATDPSLDLVSYNECAVAVLVDDLPASVVAPTLDTLDALRSLSHVDLPSWQALPYALRFDTRRSRIDTLRHALIERTMRRSPQDVREVWPRVPSLFPSVPIDLAIAAERAGVETRFQRSESLKTATTENPIGAATALREYFEIRDWSVAPDVLAWRYAFGNAFNSKEVQLLLTQSALRSGNQEMAVRQVGLMRHRWPDDADVTIMEAAARAPMIKGVREALSPVLEPIDELLARIGLRRYHEFLRRDDSSVSHWIDLFEPPIDLLAGQSADHPEVSVVMTVHNNARTVEAAVASVLASKDVALELIVIDDASNDESGARVEALADPRIRVVRNSENLGPYVSRNRALEQATGELITIADADDWSHPDRITYQRTRLSAEADLLGCTVSHIRLRPSGDADLENNLVLIGDGPMSLMFRRSVIDQIGGFDHIRTRGDIEFMRRLKARFGQNAIAAFRVPLVLATSTVASNSKRFSADALGRYRRAARDWHAQNSLSDALYVAITGNDRAAFVAPQELVVVTSERDNI